jgi:hypothetical protein
MARNTSALRRLASASTFRVCAYATALLVAALVSQSVTKVSAMSRLAPASAAHPIHGWNRKQMLT